MGGSFIVMSREETLRRIRGEYLEMPGLRLTRAQAQRLWGLDPQTCATLLTSLTKEQFLHLMEDGTYGRSCGKPALMSAPPAEFFTACAEKFPRQIPPGC